METNKYYTPSIEEFHIGFEYERKLWIENNTKSIWEKRKVLRAYEISSIDMIIRDVKMDGCSIRVKYLDAEDIESLGFVKINNMFRLGNYNTFIDMATGARIISFDAKLSTPNSDGTFKQYIIFKGFIKNKSELKKVLEMLNIKHD